MYGWDGRTPPNKKNITIYIYIYIYIFMKLFILAPLSR